MRILFLILLLMGFSTPAAADWIEGSLIGVPLDNPKIPVAVFLNSYTGDGAQAGQWVEIDLTEQGIPDDTLAVFLSGLLIITHGTTGELCNLTVSFRAPGDDLSAANYLGQAIEAHNGGGQRSTFATWVPVFDRRFEFRWDRGTGGQYPAHCAYAVNLSLQAYVR